MSLVNSSIYAISSALGANRTTATSTATTSTRPVTMTVRQAQTAINDNKLPASIVVRDSTANIQAGLDSIKDLAERGNLKDVTFTRSGAKLTLNQGQLENSTLIRAVREATLSVASATTVTVNMEDAKLLNGKKIANLSFNLSDSASNIKKDLSAVYAMHNAGKLASVATEPKEGMALQVSAVQGANTNFLAKIDPGADGAQFAIEVVDNAKNFEANRAALVGNANKFARVTVADSAENLSAMFGKWNDTTLLATAPKIDRIDVRGAGAVTLSATQATNADLMGALKAEGASPALQVRDSAANLVSNSAAVQTLRATYADPAKVAVVARDSAANIKSNLTALEQMSKQGALSGVEVTNKGKVMSDVTVKDIMNNAGVMVAFARNGGTLKVKDTADQVAGNLDSLQKLVSANLITAKSGGIEVSDASTKSLAVNQEQYSGYAGVRGLLSGTGGTKVKFDIQLGAAKNVLSQYPDEFSKITTGAGDDSVYVGKGASVVSDVVVDLGGGDDVLYLEGKKEDWTAMEWATIKDFRESQAGYSTASGFSWSTNTVDLTSADEWINQKLAESGSNPTTSGNPEDERVYRFTSGSKTVTVLGGERFGFIEADMLPKGTLDLKA